MRSRTPVRLVLSLALIGVALAGCDSGPEAGEVTFRLETPNTDDAAISFRITAREPNSITSMSAACAGCRVFSSRVGDGEVRGVITGSLSAGPLVRVLVSDRTTPAAYRAEVLEAAAGSFRLRNTAGYNLVTTEGR